MPREYQKGQFIVGGAYPAVAAVMERSHPVNYGEPPEDPDAEFYGHIARANAALDGLAALKAQAKAKADHEDFRDLVWRLGCR